MARRLTDADLQIAAVLAAALIRNLGSETASKCVSAFVDVVEQLQKAGTPAMIGLEAHRRHGTD